MSIRCIDMLWNASSPSLSRLLSAIQSGDTDTVRSSLSHQKGDALNQRDKHGKYPLHHAIISKSLNVVRLVLEHGADVNQVSYATYPRHGQRSLRRLQNSLESPLVTAVRTKASVDMVELLLKSGADPNHRTLMNILPNVSTKPKSDKAALHFACEDGNEVLADVLLRYKADPDVIDRDGETPLHKVARCNNMCRSQKHIVQLLCKHGCDLNIVNKMDRTALYIAIFYGCEQKANLLIYNNADINQLALSDTRYGGPLHIAASKELISIAKLLIARGAILDSKNSQQLTALHLNVMSFSKSTLAQVLIYHGADVNGFDEYNYSLIATAIRDLRFDCESLARLFVYAGYDLHQDTWLDPESNDPSSISVPIPHGRVRTLCDWLRNVQVNPLSLYALCRIKIRNHVKTVVKGRSIVKHVTLLPLPQPIREFLLLKGLLTDCINIQDGFKSYVKIL